MDQRLPRCHVYSDRTLVHHNKNICAASWQNQQNGMCAQRRLRSAWASAQSDQSSLSAWRKLGSLATHWAHSEDSDQTGRMSRLIWVFSGRTVILLVLSWGGLSWSVIGTVSNLIATCHIFQYLQPELLMQTASGKLIRYSQLAQSYYHLCLGADFLNTSLFTRQTFTFFPDGG